MLKYNHRIGQLSVAMLTMVGKKRTLAISCFVFFNFPLSLLTPSSARSSRQSIQGVLMERNTAVVLWTCLLGVGSTLGNIHLLKSILMPLTV